MELEIYAFYILINSLKIQNLGKKYVKKFESDCFFYIIPNFRDPVPELSVVDRAAADACRYFFPPSIFPDRKVYQGARSACVHPRD